MATLYQLHSPMDALRRSLAEMAITWHAGDSILLLGSTVAFIEWLEAYLADSDIQDVTTIYVLSEDIAQLDSHAHAQLSLASKSLTILNDDEWVALTQDQQFDKVVTISL